MWSMSMLLNLWVHVGEVSWGLLKGGFLEWGLQASPWCSYLGITAAS